MNRQQLDQITETLLNCADRFSPTDLFPTVVPEAAPLVLSNPYAFSIAVCLDRGTKADIIWTIPFYLKNELGHLDPARINLMSLDDLAGVFLRLPKRPRYTNDAPRTVKELTSIVIEEFDGEASKIWLGKNATDVNKTFQRIHGVGPGIANMGVLLIESAFGVRFEDRMTMDIKPDVHTMRVLYRLGVSETESFSAAIQGARELSPQYPGAVDGALWWIGRTWCRPTDPNCKECCARDVCAKRID